MHTVRCNESCQLKNSTDSPPVELIKVGMSALDSTTLPVSTNITNNTTEVYLPEECSTATNLTEAWRMDHNGSNIKPIRSTKPNGYACDLNPTLNWFRFTSRAGKDFTFSINTQITQVTCS